MNDEVRDMIGKALRDEPPIGLDYRSVHAAGRRRLTRRHLAMVGGAALAVVAVAGVAVTAGQLGASPRPNGPAGPATTSTPPPSPADGCVGATRNPQIRRQGGALPATDEQLTESARLTQAFAGYTIVLPDGVSQEPAKPRLCVSGDRWSATLMLRSERGDRSLYIEVRPRGGQPAGECARFGGATKCSITTLADGGRTRVSQTPATEVRDELTLVVAEAWRPDDTVVTVMESGSGGARSSTSRMLGDEELLRVALAPELKVDWVTTGPPAMAEPSDRRAAELSDVAANAITLPAGMRLEQTPGSRVEPLTFVVGQGGYKLQADLRDARGVGNLFITMERPAPDAPPLVCTESKCEMVTLLDGRPATVSRVATESGFTRIWLSTVAADGTQVGVMVINQRGDGSGGPTRPEPPLTVEDLIAIASHEGFRW